MYDDLRTLAGQLLSVPGAPDSLLPDYFSKSVLNALPRQLDEHAVEVWRLADASVLSLFNRPDGLALELSKVGVPLDPLTLPLPQDVLTASSQSGDHDQGPYQVSPIMLALTGMAAGFIEGDKPLKKAVPGLVKSAQELLLIAACRLCG
ncbi:MAG: hypothetical protein WBX11_13840 [Thiobacillaceae bacterium]